jgi:peptidoglycan-associated lipoprotein
LTLGKQKIDSCTGCFKKTIFNKYFSEVAMLKKLLTLTAIVFLFSCSIKTKSNNLKTEKENKVTETEDKSSYQTIDNEQDAVSLNQEVKVQEIEVQDRVLFSYDSAAITGEAQKILDVQADWLKSDNSITITIEGHCDERGTREYNIALGEKRADSAKNYLVAKGVDSSRIKTISYGKERPAFFGNNEEVMAKNRRAVTIVN